jgi:hypothetical protein
VHNASRAYGPVTLKRSIESQKLQYTSSKKQVRKKSTMSAPDRYGAIDVPSPLPTSTGTYALQQEEKEEHDGLMRTGSQAADEEEDDDTPEFSIQELLYSSSSYYAIAKPVTYT